MQARVIVDVNVKIIDKPFNYHIPNDLLDVIEVGMRVVVPFGHQKLLGYVVKIEQETEENLKDIIEVLDIIPTLNSELIKLSHEIKKLTFGTYIGIFNTMIPSSFRLKKSIYLKVKDYDSLDLVTKEYFKNETIDLKKIKQEDLKLIKKYITKGYIEQIIDLETNAKVLEKTYILLKPEYNKETKLSPNQKKIIDFLIYHKEILKSSLIKDLKVTSKNITDLESKGIVEIVTKEEYRDVFNKADEVKHIILNDEQQNAVNQITRKSGFNETLLYGVTGSGKTEVYIELIKQSLSNNKTALYLVPEISLTPQIIRRLKGIFGNDVAILHSGLSNNERFDEFRRINNNEVKIVVGARSAVFAPLTNIGLIIVDECHVDSYKQDESPRYHTIDIARLRAQNHNAYVIYGSATPSVEMFYNALHGKLNLVELSTRANKGPLPSIHIIDMKEEVKYHRSYYLSTTLVNKITEKIIQNEQVILLVNRKGFAEYVQCRSCGEVVKCPNCDISLTYHKAIDSMKCSYCSHSEQYPHTCPKCQSDQMAHMGTGTEMIEEELKKIFAHISIIRMDSETTRGKDSMDKIYQDFKNKKASILLGTQMVAKGLDFEDVTLVGIINADSSLYFPDYKAHENTFQLIHQASGRAGRHQKTGEVLIQTYKPEHYVLECLKENDYLAFYNKELEYRKQCQFPPFKKMVQLVLQHEDLNLIKEKAKDIKRYFDKISDITVLGPIVPKVIRINNKCRIQIVIKYDDYEQVYTHLSKINSHYIDSDIRLIIDNYPYLI